MSTASFKFWFPAFFFIFYFSSITTPWDSKIFFYHRRHVRNWLLLLKVKNNQSAVYRVLVSCKRQFLLNSSLSLEHAHLLMSPNQQKRFLNFQTHFLSYVQAILSKRTQILKQNCSPKPTLIYPSFRKKARPNARLPHLAMEGQAAWQLNITTWRPLSWVKR